MGLEQLKKLSWVDLVLWLIRIVVLLLVVIGSYNTLSSGKYELSVWIDLLINGLAQGSIYALIALGYSLVYGILFMINFAHGEVFMAGAFTAFFVAEALNSSGFLNSNPFISFIILMLVSMGTSTIIAVLLERIAYRPLRDAPRLVPLITAIGASFFLQQTFRGLYGSNFRAYPEFEALQGDIMIGSVGLPISNVVVILAAVAMMVGLYIFVERTKTGKSMRAVAEDKEIAALMGIDVNRVIVLAFVIGGMLAGAAGVFNGIFRPQGVAFRMGFIPGLKAFTAAVLGGIGNVPGAMIGGIFLGLVEGIAPNLVLEGLGFESANQLREGIAIVMLVVVLIFRPTGILGERLSEEKT